MWMDAGKNSITNRLHLHDFHQPISSRQKCLLLIRLEGGKKKNGAECGGQNREGELSPTECSCLINQSRKDFFFFLPLSSCNFAVLRAAELTRSAG